MKVVFLGTRGFPDVQGGVEKHCENLAVNLVKLGVSVTVLTRKPYVNKDITEYEGVRLIALPSVRKKSLEALLHTFIGVIYCVHLKPDIIHIHGIGPGLFAPLAKLLGFRVVLTTHGSNYMHEKWNNAEKRLLKLCEAVSIRSANQIIAVSDIIAGNIKELYNRQAHYIPNGVQKIHCEKTSGILESLGLESGKYILAVGRLVPEKGFSRLLDALELVSLNGWRVVIAGGADHKSRYACELIKRMNEDKRVAYTGFLTGDPLYELYENAGVYVLPSSYEGMPISLLEAMSAGVPCIASDIEANLRLGLPRENYFSTGDMKGLAHKLNESIQGNGVPPLTREQTNILMKEFDWRAIAEQTLQVYIKGVDRRSTAKRRVGREAPEVL